MLAHDVPGKLFIVGDPKQAIYRFRRADVQTYQEVCDLLKERGATRAYLRASFRSTPALQHLVNAAFAPTAEELAWAPNILAAAAERGSDATGAFALGDEMDDRPVVLRVRQIDARVQS